MYDITEHKFVSQHYDRGVLFIHVSYEHRILRPYFILARDFCDDFLVVFSTFGTFLKPNDG